MSLKSRVEGTLRRVVGKGGQPHPAMQQGDGVEEARSTRPAEQPRRHPPERFVHLLACPECQASLRMEPGRFICTGCARSYELQEGVPILLPEAGSARIAPVDHTSNAVGPHAIDWLASFRGYTLNIGAGATMFKLPKGLELEHAIFRNTDVVGDAHRLPFAANVFDAVLTLNTFEHLSDPGRAASEVYRVLRPGGQVFLQTAFLQPLHEAPYHFYNATEFGLRRWFHDFDIDRCTVPGNMNPAYSLAWQSSELLYCLENELGAESRELLANTTLEQMQRWWAEPDSRRGAVWDALMALSQDAQRRLSGGFELLARKPQE